MAGKRLDWVKLADATKRWKQRKEQPRWDSDKRAQMRKRNHWGADTWQTLRAKTQALADAAAPKP